jgi:RND family efflux transporter MFP subunit
MLTRRLRWGLALLLALAAIAWWVTRTGGEHVQNVTVVHVDARVLTDQPGGVGKAAAGVDVFVSLDFRDTVTAVHVNAGDTVTKGEPLFDLDPTPLVTNQTQLSLKVANDQASLVRQQGVLAIDQAKNSPLVASVQAQIQVLTGQISFDEQLLSIAQGHQPTVTAPIAGIVEAVNVAPGQSVGPGVPLADVVDFTQIQVTANLPVAVQPELAPGEKATMTFPDFPDVTLSGVVSGVGAGTTNGGTSFSVTITAPNTTDKRIRPGVNAFARVTVAHKASLTLPKAAILNIDLNPTVMVVSGPLVHSQSVQIGIDDGVHVEVLFGLKAGDVCVLVGNQTLNDGSQVHIVKDEG